MRLCICTAKSVPNSILIWISDFSVQLYWAYAEVWVYFVGTYYIHMDASFHNPIA